MPGQILPARVVFFLRREGSGHTRLIDPFRKKNPLGYKRDFCSYGNSLYFMSSRYGRLLFKFEANWILSGIDMPSQTYTHFI